MVGTSEGPDLTGLLRERYGRPHRWELLRELPSWQPRRPPDDPAQRSTRGSLWLVDGDRMIWSGQEI